jgi:hypothetical protein
MIFVVGARRSGTLWVERMLTAHPDVNALPAETHLFSHGIRPLADRLSHGILSTPEVGALYVERDRFLAATRTLCDEVMSPFIGPTPSPRARLLERSPWHVYHLDLIGALFPDAYVVHVIRDGRSVTRSLLAQTWGPETMDAAAREWAGAIRAARLAAPQLAAYREVRYEELLGDPREGIRSLYEWLGLDAADDHLEAALREAGRQDNIDVTTPWITADKWRGLLGTDQLDAFNAAAGSCLRELGYESDSSAEQSVQPSARREVARRPKRTRKDPAGAERQQRIAAAQRAVHTVDKFVSLIGERAYHRMDEVLAPNVEVTLSDGARRTQTGDAAKSDLLTTLAADESARAEQQLGEVFADGDTVTVVQMHVGSDGVGSTRTYVATLHGDRIGRLSYFRFPPTSDVST